MERNGSRSKSTAGISVEMFKFANINIRRRVQYERVVFRANCTRCDQRPLHARVSRTVRRLAESSNATDVENDGDRLRSDDRGRLEEASQDDEVALQRALRPMKNVL